jgi:hypothetical protein
LTVLPTLLLGLLNLNFLIIFERFNIAGISRVSSLVFRELSLLFEALATVSALEWLVTRVDAQVVLQVAALVKFALANSAYQN